MFNTGFPIANFSWMDNSGASTDVLFTADSEGLNVPFGFVLAERGTPGAIYFGSANELVPLLGADTFTESSPFFTPATRFLGTAMAGQGVNIMRLVDPAAATAAIALFAEVTLTDVVQYQRTVSGEYLLDVDGDPLPVLNGTEPVTEPGVKIRWFTRALTVGELFDDIDTTTVGNVTTYPVMAFNMTSPGSYGNRQGFSLYSTRSELADVADEIKSVLYRFAPYELPTRTSTTASAIPDVFGARFSDISFKDVAVYTKTGTNYASEYVLGTNYINTDSGDTSLPYEVKIYSNNIELIGTTVVGLSPELVGTDPYMIDLITAEDIAGIPYAHLEVDATNTEVVNSSVVNYAVGGTDGVTTFAKLQELIRTWLEGADHGEFSNLQQHPMTHFSDPGFSMDTKLLLFNMLALRDNLKIDLSTQDVMLPANTKAQDLSAGQTLAFRTQMYPESVVNGVGCTRVGIYAHAAKLVNGTPYSGLIPFTYNRLIQRRDLDGGSYIKGSSGGLPNSQVTVFRKPNWVADDEATRQLAWGSSINVVMHASRTELFYPSLRTVYPNDTSLLSDDEISDRILYMFKICRKIWAKYAGVRKPAKKLYPLIEKDIDDECAVAFNKDGVRVKATVFQTAADANLGYATSVNLALTGDFPIRQINFDVVVDRTAE